MNANPVLNSKIRAYGKARIDIARRAQTRADWERLWKPPAHPFPFTWEGPWKQCIEYKVGDFAAEVGFFIDVLGLPVIAFDTDYAMFTSPDDAFTFAVACTPQGQVATPPDALRIQFMVANILEIARDLEVRGVNLPCQPEPVADESDLYVCSFTTPNGIWIDLWGMPEQSSGGEPLRFEPPPELPEPQEPELRFEAENPPLGEMEETETEELNPESGPETEYTYDDDYAASDPLTFDDTNAIDANDYP